jgi:DNA polymerase-3 subunit delta'
MDITWLQSFADGWNSQMAQNRQPHAILLVGPPGVGKRNAAAWLAGSALRVTTAGSMPQHPLQIPEHADMHWIQPVEGKAQISIEQVRGLVAELSLTSYSGLGKVAVITPANAMTINAANSILKTLEEPPGKALIVLVTDSVSRLPATILSRCQRINIKSPAEDEGMAWLNRLRPGDWLPSLQAAGFAPLAAIAANEAVDNREGMARDFSALAAGRAAPLEVAARWSKLDGDFVLEWMSRLVQQVIHQSADSGGSTIDFQLDRTVLMRLDRRNLFCYLETLNQLRNQAPGSYNVLVTLESLLIDWSRGLAGQVERP